MTPDETRAAAVQAYLDGQSSYDVAEVFGVSDFTVRRWVRAAGHQIRPHGTRSRHVWLDDAAARYEAGESLDAIGRRYGYSGSNVRHHLASAGVEIRKPGPVATPPAAAKDMAPVLPVGWKPPTVEQIASHQPTPDWEEQARCAEKKVDTNVFYPGRGEALRPARSVCAWCPVQVDCAAHAIRTGEHHGVWGGLSERERRSMRRRLRELDRRHGTRREYHRGCRCDACRAANAAYQKDWRSA